MIRKVSSAIITAAALIWPSVLMSYPRDIWQFMPQDIYEKVSSGAVSPWYGRVAQDMNMVSEGFVEGPDGEDLLQRYHEGAYCARENLGRSEMKKLSRLVSKSVLNTRDKLNRWTSVTQGKQGTFKDPLFCPPDPHLYGDKD